MAPDSGNNKASVARRLTGVAAGRSASGIKLHDPIWRTTKRDKRMIKHNTLISRVRNASVAKPNPLKQRRPAKKLKTDMRELADALPELVEDEEGWEGLSDAGGDKGDTMKQIHGLRGRRMRREIGGVEGKLPMKSLSHRPGAMKRKQALAEREIERCSKNLALMTGRAEGVDPGEEDHRSASQARRWMALRTFIEDTMEKSRAFARN